MEEEKIIKKAIALLAAENSNIIRKYVEAAINKLATAQDICEMANHLGCNLTEFIDDICNKLCRDCEDN